MSASTLVRARAGDEQAFRELIAPHRRELHFHCYRMLGSLMDAEDLLQDTLTAAWRGLDGFAGRSSLRAWLYGIATNRCLNAIRDSKRRVPPEPTPPFTPPEPSRRREATWLDPYPDTWIEQVPDAALGPAGRSAARETVELAFVTALQILSARQTAALLLVDVLDFPTSEVAAMLDSSPTALKGVLQRARASLAKQRGTARHRASPEPGSPEERDLAARFAEAFTAGDVNGVIALLTDDAWLAMPPAPHEYVGSHAIGEFLRTSASWRGSRRLRLVATRANTQPAFGCYLTDPDGSALYPTTIIVLTMAGHRISAITRFHGEGLAAFFGLPD